MARPLPIEINPRGTSICTCVQLWSFGMSKDAVEAAVRGGVYPEGIIASHGLGWFVCDAPITKGAEDGLCKGCRISDQCTSWRTTIAQILTSREEDSHAHADGQGAQDLLA